MKADRNVIVHGPKRSRHFVEGEDIPKEYEEHYVPMTDKRKRDAEVKRSKGSQIAGSSQSEVTSSNVTAQVPEGNAADVVSWVLEGGSPEMVINRAAAANDQERLRKPPRKGVLEQLEDILAGGQSEE